MAKATGRKGIAQAAMPQFVAPMLCTLVREPFNDPDYLYEVKWDGYRIVSRIEKGMVRLNSRSGLDYTKKYPPVVEALTGLKHNALIDGEIIVLDETGKPSFDLLQRYDSTMPIEYYCFDLLWLDGKNIQDLPLTERKKKLASIIP